MKKYLPVIFNKRLFLLLSVGFIIATVVGTVSHEYGHYFVAKYCFHRYARVAYAYTDWDDSFKFTSLEVAKRMNFYCHTGGPLETMLTGTLGLLLLFIYRKKYQQTERLSFAQWIPIFLSLFWLRQFFNLIDAFVIIIIKGHIKGIGDEFQLARYLGWSVWSIATVTGIMGAIVLALVIFGFVPVRQRFTFMMAGLAGGLLGAYLWLVLLGPVIMP